MGRAKWHARPASVLKSLGCKSSASLRAQKLRAIVVDTAYTRMIVWHDTLVLTHRVVTRHYLEIPSQIDPV